MKDSRVREYDGWALKTERGILAWSFHLTRREVYKHHGYPTEPGCEGSRAVKVRLVEVVE